MEEKAQKCLLVLCGIPGAGKSSLAQAMAGLASAAGVATSIINFDDHLVQEADTDASATLEFDPEQWKVRIVQFITCSSLKLTTATPPLPRPPEPLRWLL